MHFNKQYHFCIDGNECSFNTEFDFCTIGNKCVLNKQFNFCISGTNANFNFMCILLHNIKN